MIRSRLVDKPRSPSYLTREGAERLAAELRELASVERPRVVQEVSDAAAQGDRSENAEYIYGKKRLRELDRRIRFITRKLDSAVIVEAEARTPGVVYFGATVEVADEDGKRSRYLVVGPDEADPSRGRLSFRSPLGQALMKRRVGDVVTVRRPAGEIDVEILAISYD
ncbi:MAG: transcription elongation factor GreB [Sorangiineae bacterium]|nr:transcription elongation factor GreB [Polyangiaceae bacterium]MEB2321939.1 transcription elongation factor GreB [Sorangiineae bacterium]